MGVYPSPGTASFVPVSVAGRMLLVADAVAVAVPVADEGVADGVDSPAQLVPAGSESGSYQLSASVPCAAAVGDGDIAVAGLQK